ncbi:MAG: tetratricopeptide repeat protein [Candidatus Marinimicrobia bacterium]|nr:tetratricopeptide repeat protein [Candidatus Neomarinimicrobiota bacterium]
MNFLTLDKLENYIAKKSDTLLFPIFANLLLENNQVERAEHLCRTGLTSCPHDADGYYVLANILLKKGNLVEAVRHLQTAIKNLPGHINAHRLLLHIGKENLSLSEIDKSHKVVQNFEKHFYPLKQISNPYFNDELFSQIPSSQDTDENFFLDDTGFIQDDPVRDNEELPEIQAPENSFIPDGNYEGEERLMEEEKFQGFETETTQKKEDELDLSEFEMNTPSSHEESSQQKINLFEIETELVPDIEIDDLDFPEIKFESKFDEQPELPENSDSVSDDESQFIPAIIENEIDIRETYHFDPRSSAPDSVDELNLNIDLKEFSGSDNRTNPADLDIFIPDHSLDNEIEELELDFSFSDETGECIPDTLFRNNNSASFAKPDISSGLSIRPVSDSFDKTLLEEIENHEAEAETPDEEISEDIPEFKSNIKNNLNESISSQEKEKVNLNIPIPTLTFVEVLQNQKLYDQALEILDILEKRSADKERIIQKKEEIIRLKSMDTY